MHSKLSQYQKGRRVINIACSAAADETSAVREAGAPVHPLPMRRIPVVFESASSEPLHKHRLAHAQLYIAYVAGVVRELDCFEHVSDSST